MEFFGYYNMRLFHGRPVGHDWTSAGVSFPNIVGLSPR